MFETQSASSTNAIVSLKADHQKVKKLFQDFEKTSDRTMKIKILTEAVEEE